MDHYIGIDVGTGSVRAALIAHDGELVASATKDTKTFRDEHDHRIFEQSTTDIWTAICSVVKSVLSDSNVSPESVKGIGFDATCSLAVTDQNGDPVVVTKGDQLGQNGERNVILWADHRAEKEAELINSTNSKVLDYVGGVMSVSTLLSTLFIHSLVAARNGSPKNPLAQKPHVPLPLLPLPIL